MHQMLLIASTLFVCGVLGRSEHTPKDIRGGASLTVMQPLELAEALGELKVSLGNFGNIQYGTSFTSRVYLPRINRHACNKFKQTFPENSMVLVNAGDCTIP